MQAFLGEVMPAMMGTIRRDGSVQLHPVWYEHDDGSILVNGSASRGWLANLRRDPRVTLLFVDPRDMFRWAQVQGAKVEEDPEGGYAHIERLAHRYTGAPYQWHRPDDPRIKVRIEPTKVGGSIDQAWG